MVTLGQTAHPITSSTLRSIADSFDQLGKVAANVDTIVVHGTTLRVRRHEDQHDGAWYELVGWGPDTVEPTREQLPDFDRQYVENLLFDPITVKAALQPAKPWSPHETLRGVVRQIHDEFSRYVGPNEVWEIRENWKPYERLPRPLISSKPIKAGSVDELLPPVEIGDRVTIHRGNGQVEEFRITGADAEETS